MTSHLRSIFTKRNVLSRTQAITAASPGGLRCFRARTGSYFVVEVLAAMVYVPGVSRALEKRVEELEHKLAELANGVTARKPRKKDWQRTFGLSRGDDGFKEMVNLGRRYRQSLSNRGNGARS